jgi:exodeoxyribonuclease VII small subunit
LPLGTLLRRVQQALVGLAGLEEGMMEAVETLSFEQAVAELEAIVQKLEGEGLSLRETETLYERGQALGAHCQQLLDAVSLRVEQLGQGEDETTPVALTPEDDG